MSQEEYREYDTVMIRISSGEEKEFAIMDEFDLDQKHYIVVSLIENDEILEGCYIYKALAEKEEMIIEQIKDVDELQKAAAYYETIAQE